MTKVASPVARSLERLILKEIDVYRAYLQALESERELVVASKTDSLPEITQERERLLQAMAIAQDERFTFMREVLGEPQVLGRQKAPPPSIKLSQFVLAKCSPQEAKSLLPKVELLRKLANQARGKSREFSEILGFSLRMIGGLASLLWSATKHVVRSYTPQGEIQEAVHDNASRKSGVLKEA